MPNPPTEPAIKPGDYCEDCSYHPCLCISAGEEDDPDGISGISLVDGSYPRSCSLTHCGVRKLTLSEALRWKKKGPQKLDVPWTPLPDTQWWSPRPREGVNPGQILNFLFDASLRFLRNSATDLLGKPIVGWYSTAGSFNTLGENPSARISYEVSGSLQKGRVEVDAIKEDLLFPITRISLHLEGATSPTLYDGEQVRGCGRAG